ncbi:MAG: hypothetical protein O7B99_13725, partial [Planctomycetota bacterium]|nr:hypothetical protein [Planctomycetota bacterium]
SLGDEVSFTPAGNPWDGCRSPTCAAGFAETVHGRTEKAVPTTDAVRLALVDGDRTLLEPWLARRRFHKDVLERLLLVLRDSAERSHEVPVGLLGVAGETAFGGVSQRVLSGLDFVECYPVLDTQELFYTARNGRTPRSLRTVFLAGEGPAGVAWQAWEHWMRGGDGLIVWCDADLEDMPARRGRLAGAVSDLRRVRAEVPDFAPAPRGVALLHDWNALAGGFLSDALLDGPTWPRRFASYQREHGRVERATRAWLRWLEDSGYQPGAVTDRPSTERFPVLIAWDEVFRPDPRIDTYLDRRLSPKGRVPFASIDGGLLEAAGVERAPWELAGEATTLPWLSTWSRDAKGTGWVCATIPNLVSKEERNAHLRELVLEIAPPAGMDLVWVHPPADEDGPRTLPAGDAAVFRLVPR